MQYSHQWTIMYCWDTYLHSTVTMHEVHSNWKDIIKLPQKPVKLPRSNTCFSLICFIYGFIFFLKEILKASYSNSNFGCKKNAKIITFCRNISHGLIYQVMSEWCVSRTWILWEISTFIWKQEEIWARWLLSLRSVIQDS